MYNYKMERHKIFTEENQRLFLGIRDNVHRMLRTSGAFTMQYAATLPRDVGAADSWTMLACVDRLVELGEIRELPTTEAAQNRVFVEAR